MNNKEEIIDRLAQMKDVPLERMSQILEIISMSIINLDDMGSIENKIAQDLNYIRRALIDYDTTLYEEKEDKKVSEAESPQNSIVQEEKTTVSKDNSEEPPRGKKDILTIVVLIIACVIIGVAIIAGLSLTKESASANNEPTYSEKHVERAKEGDYELEVVDEYGKKWIIIINEDKTVRIHPDGSDGIIYGSWMGVGDQLWINMDENPRIVFPNLEVGFPGYGAIYENFLYRSTSSARSKNPRERLQFKLK